ncbi:hypothetical protein G7046_g1255 [Stylonectria norvegica]|nr:hypothetical protein G7046_g1255 [Stylonectria norvegica]
MADLLLHSRSVGVLHAKPTKQPSRSNTKVTRSPSKAKPAAGVAGTVYKALKGANEAWQSWKDGLTESEREQIRLLEERRQILRLRMENAESWEQWDTAAKELDVIEGNEEWKQDSATGDYNPDLIEERLQALDEARANCDIHSMMHLLRTALSRDLGGMDNVDLYRHSYSGTKHLIERYVDSTIKTIEAVVTQSRLGQSVEYKDLLEGMLFARQSFGRSALLLSGGGTFGMAHVGVMKALFEAQLLPRIISGASAGSIVCAVVCTKTDEELPDLIREFPYGDLAVFNDENSQDGVLEHLRRLLTEGSWSDIKHLTRVMRGLTGDMTFQEAYNRTRRILNVCVSTASIYELPRLLNYATAPNVMIWSAVAASCSVPLVFNASPLLVKDPATGEHLPWNPSPQRWIDGSVDNDLPMTRLSEMFNVNHFIVSQVNPHVVPFLTKDDHLSPTNKLDRGKQTRRGDFDWVYTLTTLAKDEALHRLQFLSEIGFLPNLIDKARSVLSQKYSGDINILPEISMHDLPRILKNPSSDFMIRSCLLGERAAWPKLSRVRDRCAIELALDRAVHRLRARVVFSESQQDLRRVNASVGNLRLKIPPRSILLGHPATGPLEANTHRHRRRQSGGSLNFHHNRWQLLDSAITDDETEQEERLEMQSRRNRSGSPTAMRKPRLKRASRSHIHVRGALAAMAQEDDDGVFDFNFAKPVTPPRDRRSSTHLAGDSQDTVQEESDLMTSENWSDQTWQSRADITSPTEEIDTSEPRHSSDVHRDETDASDSEASDPEPYDVLPRGKPVSKAASFDDSASLGAGGKIGWGLWD